MSPDAGTEHAASALGPSFSSIPFPASPTSHPPTAIIFEIKCCFPAPKSILFLILRSASVLIHDTTPSVRSSGTLLYAKRYLADL